MENEKEYYIIGELLGAPVYHHKTQNIDSVCISYAPVNKNPNDGRSVFVSFDGSKPATYVDDGSPFIPFTTPYKIGFIVTGYTDFDNFVKFHGDTTIERATEKLKMYNKNFIN